MDKIDFNLLENSYPKFKKYFYGRIINYLIRWPFKLCISY